MKVEDEETGLVEQQRDEIVKFDVSQRFAPCSIVRFFSFTMIALVFVLVGITIIPLWYFYFDGSVFGYLVLFVFHSFLLLLLISYIQVVCTDAGSIPKEWHNQVSSLPVPGYPKCRRTQLYRPPRSRFCAASRRQVLNLDHFCPWTANAIGFRNRKFFILFCFYACLTSAIGALCLGPIAMQIERRTQVINVMCLLAFVLDCTFSVTLFLFFLAHFYMAAKNQTSVEDPELSAMYDLGWKENLKTVFGENELYWFVPVYGNGPKGDGVHWKRKDGTWDGHFSQHSNHNT